MEKLSLLPKSILMILCASCLVGNSAPFGQESKDLCVSEPLDSITQISWATPPLLISAPDLHFPREADIGGLSGKVWVRILIGKDGVPVSTSICSREPDFALVFDEIARRFAMGCRFSPARDSLGEGVPVAVTLPINFRQPGFAPPSCLEMPEAPYPEQALELGMEGWVGIMILVDEMGYPDSNNVFITTREPCEWNVFDEAAKFAAKHAKFVPAIRNGIPAKGWCFIKVIFDLPMK